MSITLDLDTQYEFEVLAPYDEVFDFLSDVPLASSLHPTHEKTIDLGGGVYEWQMKRYGTEKIHVQTVYACAYEADRTAGIISWKPVPGIGNATVNGFFKLFPYAEGTRVQARIHSAATLPVPAFMKGLVLQFVAAENKKLNEKYIKNVIDRFGGGRMVRFA